MGGKVDDAWRPPEAEIAARPIEGGSEEPWPSDPEGRDPLLPARLSLALMRSAPLGYGMAGLAYLVVVLATVAVALGALLLGMAPGMATEDETLLVIGGVLGFSVYTAAILLVSFVAYPLMTASLLRAVDVHRRGGPAPSFGSAFSTAGRGAGRILGFYVLGQLVVLLAACALYLPAFPAMAVVTWAFPLVVMEEVGAVEALSRGWQHLRRNAVWHLVVWFVLLAVLVIGELTVVGLLFLWPAMTVYQLAAWRVSDRR